MRPGNTLPHDVVDIVVDVVVDVDVVVVGYGRTFIIIILVSEGLESTEGGNSSNTGLGRPRQV